MAEDVSRDDEEQGVKDAKTTNLDTIVNAPPAVEQAVNPSEILAPSFALEDQERVATELQPSTVMAPPGYASPDPRTNAVSLLPVEDHPLSGDISEDYGANVMMPAEGEDVAVSPLVGEAPEAMELPEDTDAMTKAEWQEVAASRGLSTSGTKADIQERVEEHEAGA